jgi:alanine dehydrogenase
MPGAVGRTSTYALCNVTLPYVLQMAQHGWRNVAAANPGVAEGVNLDAGRVTNQAVAATFGLPYAPWNAPAGAGARPRAKKKRPRPAPH